MTSPLNPNLSPNYPQGPRSVVYLEANRDPTVLDTKYRNGQFYYPNTEWRNTAVIPNRIWKLADILSRTNAQWFLLSSGGSGPMLTFQGGVGTTGFPVTPDGLGNITFRSSNSTVNLAGTPNNIDFTIGTKATFTPTFSFGGGSTGLTYTDQNGVYTQVGKLVFVSIRLAVSNKGTSTGVALLSGLPKQIIGSTLLMLRTENITFTGPVGFQLNSLGFDGYPYQLL